MTDPAVTVVVGGEGIGFSWRVSTEEETFGFGWTADEETARSKATAVAAEAKEILDKRKEETKR